MRVFIWGMVLAGLFIWSASEVSNKTLMWLDVIVGVLMAVGGVASLLRRG